MDLNKIPKANPEKLQSPFRFMIHGRSTYLLPVPGTYEISLIL